MDYLLYNNGPSSQILETACPNSHRPYSLRHIAVCSFNMSETNEEHTDNPTLCPF